MRGVHLLIDAARYRDMQVPFRCLVGGRQAHYQMLDGSLYFSEQPTQPPLRSDTKKHAPNTAAPSPNISQPLTIQDSCIPSICPPNPQIHPKGRHPTCTHPNLGSLTCQPHHVACSSKTQERHNLYPRRSIR